MIGVVRVELDAEDSVTVTWSTSTTFKSELQLSGLLEHLLVIDSDGAIVACSNELCTIIIIVDREKLVKLIEDCVQ